MFKNETLVKLVLVTFILTSFGSSSLASEDKDKDEVDKLSSFEAQVWKDSCGSGASAETKKANAATCKSLLAAAVKKADGNTSGCGTAEADYKKAKDESAEACGTAFSGAGDAANQGCGQAIEKCGCNNINPSQWSNEASCRELDPNAVSAHSSSAMNLPLAARQMSICPAEAAKDIDKLESDVKEQRRVVSELQKKMPEAQRAMNNAAKQGKEKLAQLRHQMDDARDQQEDKLKEAQKQADDAQNQLAQQLLQLQEELTQNEDARGQVQIDRNSADLTYAATITKLKWIAINPRSTKSKSTGYPDQKIEAGIHNHGGFGDLMKNVGMTERQQWQRKANEFYEYCVRSAPTRKQKELAAQNREDQMKVADKAERDVDRKRQDIINRMNKIRNKDVCSGVASNAANGESMESGMCKTLRSSQDEMRRAQAAYSKKMASLGQDVNEAAESAQTDVQTEMAAYAAAQKELVDENGRLNEAEQLLALKKSIAGNNRIDQKQFDDAKKQYAKFKSTARSLVSCEAGNGVEAGSCGALCVEGANYLFSVGGLTPEEFSAIKSKAAVPTSGSAPTAPPSTPDGGAAK